MLVFAVGNARAQEGAVPLPDASYGDTASSYQSPTDLPMPAPDDLTNPDTVTIPIPGGGDITVDGPNAPSDTPLPNLPGSQWGIDSANPILPRRRPYVAVTSEIASPHEGEAPPTLVFERRVRDL